MKEQGSPPQTDSATLNLPPRDKNRRSRTAVAAAAGWLGTTVTHLVRCLGRDPLHAGFQAPDLLRQAFVPLGKPRVLCEQVLLPLLRHLDLVPQRPALTAHQGVLLLQLLVAEAQ